ncbi:MAG: septal ring lytic transglycosylase RlpA family protein [Acetobacteraceae bacterium]|nr:septal ring lytic transglycosylase RlpA family protein [Acetobacteraceae bacterium]
MPRERESTVTIRTTSLGAATGAALIAAASLAACDRGPVASADANDLRAGPTQRGEASYYGPQFRGRRMANGERFDPNSNTAAHKTLPLGTVARVTNLENGRTATVRVQDRDPYARGRVIDVSPRTAQHLDMKEDGTARVAVTPLQVPGRQQVAER